MANEEKDIYHLYAPQNETADTEASRAIKDRLGNVIDETYATGSDLSNKQDQLVSGENIKTINGESILGEGNLNLSTSPLVEITWSALKSLRDNAQLIPGMQYRITDYECVINASLTSATSANHRFDIIVLATSASVLDERARAALHENDEYFENLNLAAWELKYCIDNDISRFAWANEANGKGVIYYMKDQFFNEAPFDFKNILHSILTPGVYTQKYTFNYDVFQPFYEAHDLSNIDNKCSNNRIDPTFETPSNRMLLMPNIISMNANDSGYLCVYNHISAGCSLNVLEYAAHVDMNNGCSANHIKSSRYISIGYNCSSNAIYSAQNITIGNNCHSIKLTQSKYTYDYIVFEDHVNYISIISSALSGSTIKNAKVCQGTHGTNSAQLTIDMQLDTDTMSIYMPADMTTYIV